MLIADGGGGGGTDWAGMSIEMMRALIQNPNVEAHYKLLTGWQRSYELVGDHMAQMIGYRDNLMAAWPPKKSAAAATYRDRLNDLIAGLKATYEASIANHDAFASATTSISLAQHDFEGIWQEHEANKAKLAEYQNDVAMSSAATFDTTPPVTAMQQEAVRQKAITLMSSVSSDLAQAQVRIVRPTPYSDSTHSENSTKPFNGSTYSAPLVPPITPKSAGSGSPGTGSARPRHPSPTGSADTGVTTPNQAQPGIGPQPPGLVLGGTAPSVISPTSPGVPSPLPGGVGGAGPGVISALPPGTNPFFPNPGTATPPPGRSVARGVNGVGVPQPGTGLQEGLRAMPPGGLIGGTTAIGIGQPGSGRPSPRRVNPIGGVIGEGEASGRTIGQYGSGLMTGGRGAPAPGRGGARASRIAATGDRTGVSGRGTLSEPAYGHFRDHKSGRRDESKVLRWDPDNPWETAEGVDPVVLPPREQRVDPGPAIGLS